VGGAVALIQKDYGCEAGLRVVAEMIAHLGDDGGSGAPGSTRHCVEHRLVVKAHAPRDPAAIDKQMPTSVHSNHHEKIR